MDIHRCRFVPYTPSAINALAFSHPSTLATTGKGPLDLRLAIGRANGDIEIWNPLKGAWYQETVIRGGKDRSIEGLVWTQDPSEVDDSGYRSPGKLRLFSIGYSTAVTEWNIASGKPIRHSAGNYGEIWCMAAQPTGAGPGKSAAVVKIGEGEDIGTQTQKIAVGCADGAIILFDTSDGDLSFTRVLARPSKKKSRVLSITFQDRHTVVAGHADSTIRVYDTRNAQQIRNLTLGAGPRSGPKETLVWSVKCLNDGTIVSGDSTGTLSFWDGKNHALLQRINSHEADILEVAVSADGQSVFSGGMDRRTTLYRRMEGGGSGGRVRWAKITHQRMHRNDVKAMAIFETKNMSIMASGGLDTAPILVPTQEFGRENHRALSYLPQHPILKSAPRKRLMMSWWDGEVRIWTFPRHASIQMARKVSPVAERSDEGKTVAKILIQGEDSIASADISSDGKMLAVSTAAQVKLFRLSPKLGTYKTQKLEAPSELTNLGAKLIQFSPDMRWLAALRANDSVQLYRINDIETPKKGPRILTKAVNLKRLDRVFTVRKSQLESLGYYNRRVIRLAFSADSRILVVADISGYLDSWVLEGHEDLSQQEETGKGEIKASDSSSDENSDDDSDEENHPAVVLGQHWIRNPSASLIIKLPAAPLILTFRPSSRQSKAPLSNGNVGVHPTRRTPHPHSHDLPNGEDRLFVLTAENQMYEFNILSGKISDWSRRNPSSALPREFRDLRDRGMGAVWDVKKQSERIWLYGVNWLWMFDLSRDLPALDEKLTEPPTVNGDSRDKWPKRKREDSHSDVSSARPRHDTGAGSKVKDSEIGLGLNVARKVRKIKGPEAAGGHFLSFEQEQSPASDEEADYSLTTASTLVNFRRGSGQQDEEDEPDNEESDHENLPHNNTINGATPANNTTEITKRTTKDPPSHWHTFKYRPILGIVPLGDETDDEAEDGADEDMSKGIEVALVERPLWDLDLPPQYYGNQEWNT